MDQTLNAYLEVEEYCEQTEEHSHGGETKYQQGFPPDPLYHQALRTEGYNCDCNSFRSVNDKQQVLGPPNFILTQEYTC